MRRFFTFLVAAILSLGYVSAQELYYTTMENPSNWQYGSFYSFYNTYDNAPNTIADDVDFIEPTFIFSVATVFKNYYEGTYRVGIYSDNEGMPDALIVPYIVFENVTPTSQSDAGWSTGGLVRLTLPSPIAVNAEKYWITIETSQNYGSIALMNETIVNGENPKSIVKTGTNPIQIGDAYVGWRTMPLEVFVFNPKNNDLTVTNISSPKDNELTNSESVTITIENPGLLPQSSYTLSYQVSSTIDGELTSIHSSSELVEIELAEEGGSLEYTFPETVNMVDSLEYSILANVTFPEDEKLDNNTFAKTVIHLGELHVMGLDKKVTTNTGRFVDDGLLAENYTASSVDTLVISPANENEVVVLDFESFEIEDSANFVIYDGVDTKANILVNTDKGFPLTWPLVTAKNTSGALTVVLEDNSVNGIEGSAAGWEANVTNVAQTEVDFSVNELFIEEEGEVFMVGVKTNIFAIISNGGTLSSEKEVSFVVNDILVGAITSKELAYGQVDTVVIEWTPNALNHSTEVKALVELDPQETNLDNIAITSVSVFQNGILTDFEDLEYGSLPENWIASEGTPYVHYTTTSTYGYEVKYMSADTSRFLKVPSQTRVTLPALKPVFGDFLEYYGYTGTISVSDSLYGTRVALSGVRNSATGMCRYDLSDYAGRVIYISANGQQYMDYVSIPQPYVGQNDLYSYEFSGSVTPKLNTESLYTLKIKNSGLNDINGSDYSVELKSGETVISSFNGINVASKGIVSIVIPQTFDVLGDTTLYCDIVFNNDEFSGNNISNTLNLEVGDYFTNLMPYGGQLTNAVMGWGASSMSQMIYTPEEIGLTGDISGITFTLNGKTDRTYKYTVHVALTDLTEFADVDSSIHLNNPAYTLVYDGEYTESVSTAAQMNFSFITPFEYDGTKNLLVYVYMNNNTVNTTAPYFYFSKNGAENNRMLYSYQTNDDNAVDSLLATGGNLPQFQNEYIPQIKWDFVNDNTREFTSTPVTEGSTEDEYTYDVVATFGTYGTAVMSASNLPEGLMFTETEAGKGTITGTPLMGGVYPIDVIVTDGTFTIVQKYELYVASPAEFVSTPVASVVANTEFVYNVVVEHVFDSIATITLMDGAPVWMSITDNGDNTATISGTPTEAGNVSYIVKTMTEGMGRIQRNDLVVTAVPVLIPVFTSTPVTIVEEDAQYTYNVTVAYDGEETLSIEDTYIPGGLTLTDNTNGTATLTGVIAEPGMYDVILTAIAGDDRVKHEFKIEVTEIIVVPAVPVFTSTPVLTVDEDVEYVYDVVVSYEGEETLTIEDTYIPEGLILTDNGDGTAVLKGTITEAGTYGVVLFAIAGTERVKHQYEIEVKQIVGVNDKDAFEFSVYPNPAKASITVTNGENSIIRILDITGKVMLTTTANSDSEIINISELNAGIYFVSMTNNDGTATMRLVVE